METLNTQVQPFFEWLLRTTLQASLMVCLILLLQRILRSKLGIRWHYSLWLLLLVRMSLPWAPQSRVSLFNLIPRSVNQQQIEYVQPENSEQKVGSDVTSPASIETIPTSPAVTTHKSPDVVSATPTINQDVQVQLKPDFSRILKNLPILWLTGALVLAVYVCAGNFNLWRIVKSRRPLIDQKILELLEDCKSQMGIQTILGIVTTDKVKSPALFGFVRPRLLLPTGMIDNLSREELRFVFLHELAHLKRRDIYIGWLISVLQVLHWFNPLVWLAFRRMRADRELACDALVLDRTRSDEPKSYGRIIVSLLERFSCPRFMPGMAGILETKSQLKRRITMITRFKKNSYQWSPLAVIMIIILACVFLPNARRTKASQTSRTEHAPKIAIRRVWSDSYGGTSGSPSPDGRYLSYTDWQTGDLAIYDIAAGTKRRLTNKGSWDESDECVYSSVWSPDSKQIVYAWEIREQGSGYMDLRVIRLDGSEPRILYTDKETEWARVYDWSPDNKKILTCMLGKDGTARISSVSFSDGSVRTLKAAGKYEDWPREMSFSPDGQYIAYSCAQKKGSKNHDISIMTTEGRRETSLVEHPANDFVLGWAPNGKGILFASDRAGTLGIWLIATADAKPRGTPRLVKQNVGRFEPLGFTKKGSYYYATSTGKDDVYVATLDPKTITIVAPPQKAIERYEGSNMVASYSPDGKQLAYVYQHNRGKTLCIRSLESGQEREFSLRIRSISTYCGLNWSGDCRSILINGGRSVNKVDTQTGELDRIVQRGRSGVWSHDGKAVLYLRGDPEHKVHRILARDLATSQEEVLYQSAPGVFIYNMAISPDGQWLALRCIRPTSLKILPVAGGQSRELPEFKKVATIHKPITWTADNQHILFSGNESGGGKHPLYRISVETGKTERLGLQMNRYHALSAHPDGRRILVSCSESATEQEFWVMENFLPEAPVAKPEPTPTLRQIEVRGRGSTHSRPSFDGKYMLDVDKETGNLVARELATGKERVLTKNSDPNRFVHGSLISHDSKKVAFYHFNPDKEDFDLRIVGLDGSGLRTLLGAEIAGYFNMDVWSPDGKYIFGKLMKKPVQLVRLSADDGSIEVLKTFDQGGASNIDVSADGRYLAYSRAEQKNSKPDIFIHDLEQNITAPLVTHPAADKLLGWTPDGQHIFFTSDRNGTWDGWLLRVVDGKPDGLPEVIKAGLGNVSPLGFTRGGSFYYAFQHEAWNVYTAALDSNTGEVVSDPEPVRDMGSDVRPDWSPDGRYLAYCSQPNRDKPQIIRIRTLATGQESQLKTELPHFDWLRWCPDSRHLLITNFNRGSLSVVYKLDVQTGEHTALVQSDEQRIRQAEFSADGKTLAYRIRGSGNANRLIVRDMETGREKELLRSESMGAAALIFWALSPDGKHVALSMVELSIDKGQMNRAFVLKIISIASGETRTVVGDSLGELAWTRDGRDLLFVKGFKELWRVSAEGGEPRKLWEWKRRQMLWGLRIHPDGQRFAFFSGGNISEMWVMENFLPTTVAVTRK
jgi:Tol biopolymer transport system component/beta-lactamase regulating signal transducer with metallopeptidase domain